MLARTVRSVCVLVMASLLVGATVLAGDPWNTGSLWHTGNPWNAPTASPTPETLYEPSSSVSAVPSVAAVPSSVDPVPTVSYGAVPTPIPLPASVTTPVPPITTNGIGLRGDPSAGAHIVMMKCAGCHGQDGAGQGVQLEGLNVKQPPIPWNSAAAMSGLTDQQIAAKISQSDRQQNPDAVMPSFGDQLSAEQIDDVVAYIRMLGK
ncbi:MAG: cytochrome c [Deltaproteobacteria bacterium]|nr:cytochrome c [Deltaproteobacteria bacterium]